MEKQISSKTHYFIHIEQQTFVLTLSWGQTRKRDTSIQYFRINAYTSVNPMTRENHI